MDFDADAFARNIPQTDKQIMEICQALYRVEPSIVSIEDKISMLETLVDALGDFVIALNTVEGD